MGSGWPTPRPGRTLPPGKRPGTIVQEAGWAPGPVWTAAGNVARAGIRSTDRPARVQSLYRLGHPGPYLNLINRINEFSPQTRHFLNLILMLPVLTTNKGAGGRVSTKCLQHLLARS